MKILAIPAVLAAVLYGQTFTDITTASGLEAIRNAKPVDWWNSGLHFVDLNNDGILDWYASAHGQIGVAAINNGSGVFTTAAGTYPTTEIHIPYDINEDGRLDFSMTSGDGGGQWWVNNSTVNSLSFSTLGISRGSTRQQAMADINMDGNVDWLYGAQNSGIFMEYGNGSGIFGTGADIRFSGTNDGISPVPVDLDNDGDKDLVVEWGRYDFESGRSRIYQNNGSGVFTDVTVASGLYQDSLAIQAVGDVDHDGDVDLVAIEKKSQPFSIFLNSGSCRFSKKSSPFTGVSGRTVTYASWGLGCITDFDNDGIGDLIICGRNYLHVYRGTGSGNFTYMNSTWGNIANVAEASVDNGFTFGDIDRDGDLDLMGYREIWPNRYYKVYRNDLPAKNWIRVRPVGLAGNKGAAGSRIRIFEAGTSNLLWFEEVATYCKQVQQSYGYAYAQTERHYGLNARTLVDVEVEFYPSGTKVKKSGAANNKTWVISENGVISELAAERLEAADAGIRFTAGPNPFNRIALLQYSLRDEVSPVRLEIFNASGKRAALLLNGFVQRGNHQAIWNADKTAPAVYVARLQVGGKLLSRKILLVK